ELGGDLLGREHREVRRLGVDDGGADRWSGGRLIDVVRAAYLEHRADEEPSRPAHAALRRRRLRDRAARLLRAARLPNAARLGATYSTQPLLPGVARCWSASYRRAARKNK